MNYPGQCYFSWNVGQCCISVSFLIRVLPLLLLIQLFIPLRCLCHWNLKLQCEKVHLYIYKEKRNGKLLVVEPIFCLSLRFSSRFYLFHFKNFTISSDLMTHSNLVHSFFIHLDAMFFSHFWLQQYLGQLPTYHQSNELTIEVECIIAYKFV